MVHRIIIAIILLGTALPQASLEAQRFTAQQRAAYPEQGSLSVAELEAALRAEPSPRTLAEATPQELLLLRPSQGGILSNLVNERAVFRIGGSVFIIDMLRTSALGAVALCFILFFFTPLGMAVFRGGLHGLAGTLLEGSGIARRLGRQLRQAPRRHLVDQGNARDAFAAYMRDDFIPLYKNNVTAVAFLGTAFLIFVIGLRGIKFMVPHQPDLIIAAILVEVAVLCLLGLTTWYDRAGEPAAAPAPLSDAADLRSEDVIARLEDVIRELQESVGSERALRGLDLVRATVRKS